MTAIERRLRNLETRAGVAPLAEQRRYTAPSLETMAGIRLHLACSEAAPGGPGGYVGWIERIAMGCETAADIAAMDRLPAEELAVIGMTARQYMVEVAPLFAGNFA